MNDSDYVIFNGGGACVADGCSLAYVLDMMTESRFERGWTVVAPYFVCLHSMDELTEHAKRPRRRKPAKAAPISSRSAPIK